MTQENSWKIFPKYMILNKNWNLRFSGDDSEGFLENFSRPNFYCVFEIFQILFQLRQKKPLTYYARGKTINGNDLNRWKSYPYNENKLFLRRHSWNEAGKIFQKSSSLMTRNQKFWKKSGKIFQETLWVTTRFLEIFSRIWQYGLIMTLTLIWLSVEIKPEFGKWSKP